MSLSVAAATLLAQTGAPGITDILPHVFNSFDLMLAAHLIQVLVLLGLLRSVDWYEREPIGVIVGMFLWGGTAALAISGLLNTWLMFRLPEDVNAVFGAAITAPIVEESAKGLALLAVFGVSAWAGKRFGLFEFGGVTDGVVYGAAVGFGFAFFENVHYFVNVALESGPDAGLSVFLMRVNFLGVTSTLLLHAVATALIGAGLGMASWAHGWGKRLAYGFGGLAAGMLLHAVWNGMVSLILVQRFGFDRIAYLFSGGGASPQEIAAVEAAMDQAATVRDIVFYLFLAVTVAAVVLWLRHEGKILRYELAEEVNAGLLPRDEWELITRFWPRSRLYWSHTRQGRFEVARALKRSHDAWVDLGLYKWRVRTKGADVAGVAPRRHHIVALREYTARIAGGPSAPATTPTAGAQAAVDG